MMVVDGSAGCYVWPEDRVLLPPLRAGRPLCAPGRPRILPRLGEKLGWGLPHVAKPGTLPLAS